ncbi:50S ribosomal protein L16 [Candidatus Peregrinibacteria bacterium CG_4_9_14_0_2_um_filter_53_11]|nr:MAG: 50S ribosomal protein L16 [Candidatus Peregrinibacteria bacterium CG_4_9_14_0_2_um_filter_53_11]
MLQPKKMKYRRWHRMRDTHKRVATSGTRLAFGKFGLKCTTGGELTSRQIEAARRAIAHAFKRGGKIWIRVFPHKPITKKAAEVPMGSGKGMVELYVAEVRRGNIVFEVEGVTEEAARHAMYLAGSKLPVATRFITSHS